MSARGQQADHYFPRISPPWILKRWRSSLEFRLTLGLSLLIILIMGTTSTWLIYERGQSMRQAAEAQALDVSRALAVIGATAVLENLYRIQEAIQQYIENPEILEIDVIDGDHMIVAARNPERIGLELTEDPDWQAIANAQGEVVTYAEGANQAPILVIGEPLYEGETIDAWIRVVISLSGVQQEQIQATWRLVLMTLLLMAVALGALRIAIKRVSHGFHSIVTRLENAMGVLGGCERTDQARTTIEVPEHDASKRGEIEKVTEVAIRAADLLRSQSEALRREHNQTERLLSSISSILIGMDDQGRITRWNGAAASTFGLATGAVLGKALQEIAIKWDWPQVERGIKKCMKFHQPLRLDDLPYTQPTGQVGFLGLVLSPVTGIENQPSGVLVLGVDLSENKLLEAQLALSQKMESIGQLAAGIAHEINTPTQYVSDNLRFLQDGFASIKEVLESYATLLEGFKAGAVSPDLIRTVESTMADADVDYMTEEIPKALQQALEGANRVATIVRAMKDFSHPGTTEKKPIDLNKAIESTVTVARNEWKYVADLVTDLDPALPSVPCLPGEFNQVLLNLIINAAHALADVVGRAKGEKGRITISTRVQGEWAEVRVADTGTGIPEAVRSKIFDPFFTTKEVGKGTGQGLSIAHDVVVKKHGGTLTFETEMGKGTTFVIRLPLKPDAEMSGAALATAGSETGEGNP